MGSDDLHTDFIDRPNNEKRGQKPQNHLSEVKKGVVGVDISPIIYRFMKNATASSVFDTKPNVPLYAALESVTNAISSLINKHQLNIILCFDNNGHPMKADTQAQRRKDRLYYETELNNIYSNGICDDAIADTVKSHRKNMAAPREDLIAMIKNYCDQKNILYCASPFEADWQLVALQQMGIIQYIMSIDGDLFLLGGGNIISEVSFSSGACCIYRRDKIMLRESMGSGKFDKDDLPLIGCFSGNDYIKRLCGNGHKTVLELMTRFKALSTMEDKKKFISSMEASNKWTRGGQPPAIGFADKFWETLNLQKYAPTFKLKPFDENIAVDITDNRTYYIALAPLNPLPTGTTNDKWGNMIGFGCDPHSLLKSVNYEDIFHLNAWGKEGRPPRELPLPTLQIEPHHEVPHGSYLDTRIPTELQSDWSLARFLQVRNLAPTGKYNRRVYVRLVNKVLKSIKTNEERAPQPLKHDDRTDVGAYSDKETLIPRQGSSTVYWSSSWEAFKHTLASVADMDDDNFFDIFGYGCSGIQKRAQKLIKSGHFDVSKVQVANVALKSNGHNAIAIRMKSVPSMKTEPYNVMAVFDCESKKFICAPCSRCECPAGLGGCSHLRALYAILSIIKQLITSHTKEDIVQMFPPALSTMKGLPVPWEYAFTDSDVEKELKRLQASSRNSLSAINTRLSQSIALDEDEDSDEDSDYIATSDEESDEDDNEAMDLDEVDSTDTEDMDELLEQAMASQGESRVPSIKLCEFTSQIISESKKRAELSGASTTHEHKFEQNKIQKALSELLQGIGGPEESIDSKLYQLYLHRSFDEGYEAGEYPKNMLSFYLMKTRAQRDIHIKQLEAAKMHSLCKSDLCWTAQRLEKCPPGMTTLADRGFSECAVFYPHLNAVITPSFIDGRLQFTVEEIMGDRPKCESRYSSEAYFKRVWDSEFVTDKVPRHRFHHFQHILKWSMGMANMCQPYMIPNGEEQYFPRDTIYHKRVSKSRKRKRNERDSISPPPTIFNKNFILDAMPTEYVVRGLDNVALLNDGKDFVTDTIRINSCVSRGQYSDKMKTSAARYVAWTLPCGLSVTYSPLFLGRISEKAVVEYWGGSTSNFLNLVDE